MSLAGSIRGVARLGAGAIGQGLGAVRANAGAVAGDLLGRSPSDPLEERDPDFIRATLPLNTGISYVYHRPQVRGLEHIPADGPALLVGNHSGGTMIIDTFVFSFAFYNHFGADRAFHQLAHDVAVKLPGLSAVLRRYGTLPASHDEAERALEEGAAVLVYPGGDYESFRPSWHSDQVEFGGRSGFIRLALNQGVPIVPVVAIGGQESGLFLTRGQGLARLLMLDRLLRIKVLPIIVGPPWGISFLDLPLRLPLPSQVTIRVLPPIDLEGRFGDDPDEDEVYEFVTQTMQEALDDLAAERDLPVIGSIRGDRSRSDGAAPEGEAGGGGPDGAGVEREETDEGAGEAAAAKSGAAAEVAAGSPPPAPWRPQSDGQAPPIAAQEAPAFASEVAPEPVADEVARERPGTEAATAPPAPEPPLAPQTEREPVPAPQTEREPLLPAPALAPEAPPEEDTSTLVAEFADPSAEDGAGAELHVEEPWPGYAGMRVADVEQRLASESDEAVMAVRLYEATHRNRRGVLTAVDRELKRRR